jgi:hypothetical protein
MLEFQARAGQRGIQVVSNQQFAITSNPDDVDARVQLASIKQSGRFSSHYKNPHCRSIVEQKSKGGELVARPTVHPHIISLNKKIGEVGLTHELCPLRHNHVIIHRSNSKRRKTLVSLISSW